MIDSPITIDELQAYADGELPADRREAVEAWLAAHPADAARVADWRAQADLIRSRYGAVGSEPVPARLDLGGLDRSRHSWRAIAAAALTAFLIGGATGWVANGATASAPSSFDRYTAEALDAYKLFVVEVRHPVEVPGAEREHLLQWLSKRLGSDLRAPDLGAMGLALVGGRLLPGPTGNASAFFMYEAPSGERFTLICTPSGSSETALRYRAAERYASFYWVDRGLAYVVTGPADRSRLGAIAKAAYDQIDDGTRPGGA
jgi:anti-sigma factor RsiW